MTPLLFLLLSTVEPGSTSTPSLAQGSKSNLFATEKAVVIEQQAVAETTAVEPYRSRYSLARRLLALPSRLWQTIWWPLGQVIIWEERTAFHQRMLNFLLNDARTAGFYPIATLGGATGAGFGLNVFHNDLFGRNKQALITGVYSGPRNYFVTARYVDPAVAETPITLNLVAAYLTDSEEDFFPGGRASRVGDEREYASEQVRIAAAMDLNLTSFATVGVNIGWSQTITGNSRGEHDPLPPDTPGLGRYALLQVGVGGGVGWVNDPVYPTQGVTVRANVTRFDQTDGDRYAFTRAAAEIRGFVPLSAGDHVLALRARVERVRPDADRQVPFYEWPVLGTSLSLRGYERNRFRDTGSLLFNIEYRYAIWDTWNAVLFLDEGQVFNRVGELRLNRFRYAVGTGIHFRTRRSFILRIEVGWSPEKVRPLFQLEKLF
jgi:outer membrane translocation and assembly module TamA